MKILVTAGATREPIDAVRFLSNVSTGATGTALAAALIALGHHVTLLHGTGSVPPPATVADTEIFSSAAELFERLDRRLGPGQFDAVIMTAAVADYRPSASADGKLPSTAPEFLLPLVRNAKLLPRIKSLSPHPLTVVGFKLTVGADAPARAAAVAALFAAGGVDLVAHNDLAEIPADRAAHPFHLYRDPITAPRALLGAPALAAALFPR
jgi:phosphopantothenoylcysteine decarboxylase/phosphopantothenate--cysteine ligase